MALRFAAGHVRGRTVRWMPACRGPAIRTVASVAQRREGDISDAFASLSGVQFGPLEPRFATLKAQLIAGNEEALSDSWNRLLATLREEIPLIAEKGSAIVPEIDFKDIGQASQEFKAEHKKRGVAVIRNVLPEHEAIALKEELRAYIAANPHTKAFPPDDPSVYELYFSPTQIKARSHPNMIEAQRFLLEFWHSDDPDALISSSHPISYADRLRIRLPGDAKFALGAHVDSGSCERWEPNGYGRGSVFDKIWKGQWERFDPWESSCRLPVNPDLYNGVGACSMFRMFQGILSLSNTGPYEGTLLVNPLFRFATAYYLLRPFFSPKRAAADPTAETFDESFLAPDNWQLDPTPTSWLHGATPGHGQELRPHLHPHLDLPRSMVHAPRVRPGDYVTWHCDTIHAVDKVHAGSSDSSALYIPACPLTVANAEFLSRQRYSMLRGYPCPDFGGGKGESEHVGRFNEEDIRRVSSRPGLKALGLSPWNCDEDGLTTGQKTVMERSNQVLELHA